MTTYCFLIQPRENKPPFNILPGEPKTVGFTDDDSLVMGQEYLGDISKDKSGHFSYCQRTASFRTRLTPENLKAIARQIKRLNEQEHTKVP